jgi:hypothetical protein
MCFWLPSVSSNFPLSETKLTLWYWRVCMLLYSPCLIPLFCRLQWAFTSSTKGVILVIGSAVFVWICLSFLHGDAFFWVRLLFYWKGFNFKAVATTNITPLEDSGLLGCDTMSMCLDPDVLKDCSAFITQGQNSPRRHLEDEGTMLLWNIGNYTCNDMMLHPRRLASSAARLWEP